MKCKLCNGELHEGSTACHLCRTNQCETPIQESSKKKKDTTPSITLKSWLENFRSRLIAGISKMVGTVVAIGIVIIAIVVVSALSQDTQYEKDYNSSRSKTWDQMTPGEKDVTRAEIEWRVKKSGLYD